MSLADKLKNIIKVQEETKSGLPDLVNELQEQHRVDYGAGFEEIYAWEKIDVKSIRRINENVEKEEVVTKVDLAIPHCPMSKPIEDSIFDDSLTSSLHLLEPIHVLNLSASALKALNEHGKYTIKDLLDTDDGDWIHMKGMGQSHIDEIKTKLREKIASQEMKQDGIDAVSLLKVIVGDQDRVKLTTLLSSYHLTELFPLTVQEKPQFRKLNTNDKKRLAKEVIANLQIPIKQQFFDEAIKHYSNNWLLPWCHERMGLVKQKDIEWRWLTCCLDKKNDEQIFKFLSDVYLGGQPVFCNILKKVDEEIYCTTTKLFKDYEAVIEKVESYFYNRNSEYSLNELIIFCEKEWVRNWDNLPLKWVEKVLRVSPKYCIRKDYRGELMISLA